MTVQMSESLTYDGRHYNMATFPLTADQFKQANLVSNGRMRSDCWRGYVGSWEIKSGDLYLTDIKLISFEEKSFSDIFKDATADGLKATWVNGTLKCTRGDVIYRDRYHTLFEYDTEFNFEEGRLVSAEEKKNEPPAKK